MKKIISILSVIIVLILIFVVPKFFRTGKLIGEINDFETCVIAGNPVMESYPRQCRHNDQTFVEEIESLILKTEALEIAQQNKECSTTGVLTDDISYNSFTKTWWIDLERIPELEKDGCNPACVVNEETKTSEVNWRCTGLKEAENL